MTESIHHVTFEQLVENQLDLDIGIQQFGGFVKTFANCMGIERIVVGIDTVALQDDLEARADREQRVFVLRSRARDHVFDRDVVFQVVELDQGQLGVVLGLAGQFPAFRECREATLHCVIEVFLQSVALEADLAHGFEVKVALAVVVDLVREFEQRVIGTFHQHPNQVIEAFQGKFLNRLIYRPGGVAAVYDLESGCCHISLLPAWVWCLRALRLARRPPRPGLFAA